MHKPGFLMPVVTGFAKTVQNCTTTEIHFNAWQYSHPRTLIYNAHADIGP